MHKKFLFVQLNWRLLGQLNNLHARLTKKKNDELKSSRAMMWYQWYEIIYNDTWVSSKITIQKE